MDHLGHYREIWLIDFEFRAPDGERPEPACMVAREYRSGRTLRVWADELADMAEPPFPTGPDALTVAYFASAEMGCFLTLGWQMPARVLDLFCEFRNLTNGLGTVAGNGLLGALTYFGLGVIDAAEKTDMRNLAIRGGPYTDAERVALLDYCETDVVALAKLLPAMAPKIDLSRALLRGRYMSAVASMEWNGVPIDVETLSSLRDNWDEIKGELVERIDAYGIFVPAGQALNPQSMFGAQVLRTAEDQGVDACTLADAARDVWRENRAAAGEFREALQAARKTTGLTPKRISNWENAGRDYSTWPGWDATARELAAEYPSLGLGRGFEHGTGFDDTDYTSRLWEVLRSGARPSKPQHDPEIVRQAAQQIASAGERCRTPRLSFSSRRFAEWLAAEWIPWPRLESGALALDDDTFRQMARTNPAVAPLRELRHSLGTMRLFSDLAVGGDGRNRCLLSPFRSITGRNQPSIARFIFGPSAWLRSLIHPEPGMAVAYVDWSQQEFGIAAALSSDPVMMDAYSSGDPYLAFAKQAGAVPLTATKKSHPAERSLFKACVLATQYGMGAKSLALRIGQNYCGCTGRPTQPTGAGPRAPSTTRCCGDGCRPCLAGGSTSVHEQTHEAWPISPCRPTVRKCCDWPVVCWWNVGFECAAQCMMRSSSKDRVKRSTP